MKKAIILLLCLFLFCGCADTNAPQADTPQTPAVPQTPQGTETPSSDTPAPATPENPGISEPSVAEPDPQTPETSVTEPDVKVDPLPLPISADGTDWNDLAVGNGSCIRSSDAAPLFCAENAYVPFNTVNLSHIEPKSGIEVSASMPLLSFINKGQAAQRIEAQLYSVYDRFLSKVGSFEIAIPDGFEACNANAWCNFYPEVIGEYLCVSFENYIFISYFKEDEQGHETENQVAYNDYQTLLMTFDLHTGKKLELRDIFYSDVDYPSVLNSCIVSGLYNDSFKNPAKRAFRGIPEGYTNFTITYDGKLKIRLPSGNPYTEYSATIEIPLWKLRDSVCLKPFDPALIASSVVTSYGEAVAVTCRRTYLENTDYYFAASAETGVRLCSVNGDTPVLDLINQRIAEMNAFLLSLDSLEGYYLDNDYDPIYRECGVNDNLVYILFSAWCGEGGERFQMATFDLNTGKEIFLSDILLSEDQYNVFADKIELPCRPFPAGFSVNLPIALYNYGAASFPYNGTLCIAEADQLSDACWEKPLPFEAVPQDTPDITPPEKDASLPDFTAETLPRIDGSTATIPLSEGFVSQLLSYTPEQAQAFVHHNTTHYAYENLINGLCDIIFVTPPSEEELSMLAGTGDEFEIVRIVKDAFVFLVNAQNPVDNISLADLRDVYRGRITSWKSLGGDDTAIVPYQRPDNSGSQTLMYKLCVPADEIMPAPRSLRPEGMGDLVDVISDYDTGKPALGYSVYYYASGMYTSDGSRLIAVDGVFPTNETIADESYPLVDGYYAVYRKNQPAGSRVAELMDYILSESGQQTALAAGYVPEK